MNKEKQLKAEIKDLRDRLEQADAAYETGLEAYKILEKQYETLLAAADEDEEALHIAEEHAKVFKDLSGKLIEAAARIRNTGYWRRLWLAINGESP